MKPGSTNFDQFRPISTNFDETVSNIYLRPDRVITNAREEPFYRTRLGSATVQVLPQRLQIESVSLLTNLLLLAILVRTTSNNSNTKEEFEQFFDDVRDDPNAMGRYDIAFLKAVKKWAEGRRRYHHIVHTLAIEISGRELLAWNP